MKKKPAIFPFSIRAYDMGTWVQSPSLALAVLRRLKNIDPDKITKKPWYAVDVDVLSSTHVTLTLYAMRCNFHGGIGKVIQITPKVAVDATEQPLIDQAIQARVLDVATAIYNAQKAQEREEAILKIASEIQPA